MKGNQPRLGRAFTLVELLAVICIVVVLVALIIPLTGKLRYAALQGKSISNLRSMGGALQSYVADQNGFLPEGAFRPTLHGTTTRFWFNALDYYFDGSDYTTEGQRRPHRPSWQNDPLKVFREPVWDGNFAVNVGYGWNHGEFGYTAGTKGWASRLAEVERPTQTIIIGTSKEIPEGANVTLGNLMIYADSAAARRYNGKGMYLLLDGHVAAYSPEEIMANGKYLFLKRKPITNP